MKPILATLLATWSSNNAEFEVEIIQIKGNSALIVNNRKFEWVPLRRLRFKGWHISPLKSLAKIAANPLDTTAQPG